MLRTLFALGLESADQRLAGVLAASRVRTDRGALGAYPTLRSVLTSAQRTGQFEAERRRLMALNRPH